MRKRERNQRYKHRRNALPGGRCLNISWLLRATQNGIEDAEAILGREERVEFPSYLGEAWNEACYSVEQLEELRAAGALKTNQDEHFTRFLRRIELLLPKLRRYQWREPRIDWTNG